METIDEDAHGYDMRNLVPLRRFHCFALDKDRKPQSFTPRTAGKSPLRSSSGQFKWGILADPDTKLVESKISKPSQIVDESADFYDACYQDKVKVRGGAYWAHRGC